MGQDRPTLPTKCHKYLWYEWRYHREASGKSDSRAGHGSAGAGCLGHRYWTCRDTLALLLPAQVPAALSAGAEAHTLPCLFARPLSQMLTSYVQSPHYLPVVHCHWSTCPHHGELRAGGFRVDCLEGNTDALFEHLTSWVCRGPQLRIL